MFRINNGNAPGKVGNGNKEVKKLPNPTEEMKKSPAKPHSKKCYLL
jgi:hypothetical protein